MSKIVTAREALKKIQDNSTVAIPSLIPVWKVER